MKCPACGNDAYIGARSCARCGLPLTPPVEPAAEVDETVQRRLPNATFDRFPLSEQRDPGLVPAPLAEAWEGTPALEWQVPASGWPHDPGKDWQQVPASGWPHDPAKDWQQVPANGWPHDPANGWPHDPANGWQQDAARQESAQMPGYVQPWAPPAWRIAPPPEIWLVSVGMLVLAGILLDPVVRYAFPVLPHLFGSTALERAFSALFVFVFFVVAACAVALVLLAGGLLRNSRVAQGLTVVLSTAIAVGELADGQTAQSGGADHSSSNVMVILMCLAVVALVTLPPTARRFFGQDSDRPFGVIVAAVAGVYFGFCIIACGLLLMLVGGEDVKFVWWGLAFVGAGSGLLAMNRPLRVGHSWARGLASMLYISYVVLNFVFAYNGGDAHSIGNIIQAVIGIGAVGLLWLTPSSNAHFASGPHAARVRSPAVAVGWVALAIATMVFAVTGFAASAKSNERGLIGRVDGLGSPTSSYSPYSPPTYGSPTPISAAVPSPTPTLQAGA